MAAFQRKTSSTHRGKLLRCVALASAFALLRHCWQGTASGRRSHRSRRSRRSRHVVTFPAPLAPREVVKVLPLAAAKLLLQDIQRLVVRRPTQQVLGRGTSEQIL